MRFVPKLLLLLILTSCQVKEKATDSGIINNHRTSPNAFTIVAPESKSYDVGDRLAVEITFPTTVEVDTTVGVPTLAANIGGLDVQLVYVSGDGTKKLLFEYFITPSDFDGDGIRIHLLNLNGSTLTFSTGAQVRTCNSTITAITFPGVLVNSI